MPSDLVESAPAKVNLTLRVLGCRADGYHDIESLVTFADVGDRLALTPGDALTLTVVGPGAARTGAETDNLVTKAARALAARVPGLQAGAFRLEKNLPVAAGLGGKSVAEPRVVHGREAHHQPERGQDAAEDERIRHLEHEAQ